MSLDNSNNTNPVSTPYVQTWASQTLFAGSMGSIYGLLHAFLHSKPMNIHVTSYGINTAIFTGTFLGCRYYTLQLLNHQYGGSSMNTVPVIQQQKNNELYASTISSAIVGGVATGSILGLRRVPQGVALWTAVGYFGQYGYHIFNNWREETAQGIRQKRSLLSNSSTGISSLPSSPSSSPVPPSSSISTTANSSGRTLNTREDSSNNTDRLHVPTFSSWLPVSNSTEESQQRQQQKLLLRLKEINELLGIERPPVDPRVTTLDELEQRIIEKEKQLQEKKKAE